MEARHNPAIGVIEVGAPADLILLNSDPLANLALVSDPQTHFSPIMKDGVVDRNRD